MKNEIEKQAFIVQKLPLNSLIYLKIPQEKSKKYCFSQITFLGRSGRPTFILKVSC